MAFSRNSRRPNAQDVPITEGSASGTNRHGVVIGDSLKPSGSSLNRDSDWRNILSKLGSGSDLTRLLAELGIGGFDPKDAQIGDWNSELLKQILQYYITQEQRQYDKSLQSDQRLYDAPTNMLARLMGAGISRDAAIQMLSGGSGGSGASVPYGITGNQAGLIPESQSFANDMQAKTAIANTVFSGIGALSGLVSLGFSIPQAIQQVNALGMQNFMSQKAMIGLQAADDVLGVLQNAVDIGALSTEDMDGFSNATDALNYINDHKDAPAFKSVFDNGSFANVYGSKLGRQMFTEAWNNVRQSKDAGTLLDQHLRQQDLRNALFELDGQLGHMQLEMMSKQLLQADEQLKLLMQQFRRGEVEIKIAGEVLDAHKYENVFAKHESEAFEAAMTTTYDGEPTGQDLLAESTWREMYAHWRKLSIEQSPENIDAYTKFLQNNFDAACYVAMIKAASTKQLSDVWNSEDNNGATLWNRFTNIFFGTKTDQIVQLATDAAAVGAAMYGASPYSRQGSVRRVHGF